MGLLMTFFLGETAVGSPINVYKVKQEKSLIELIFNIKLSKTTSIKGLVES